MEETSGNPARNRLPSGMSEATLVEGVHRSGYPVQGLVAHSLTENFLVVEEWGFIDDESGEHRTLDVYAHRDLAPTGDRVEPGLLLLIECKRSEHPYVFFQTSGTRDLRGFPIVSGLTTVDVGISDGRRSTSCTPSEVLCLPELPFLASGPAVCSAFSQAIPNGKKAKLSGADPYMRVILPLLKALRHANRTFRLSVRQEDIFPCLQLAVCVLDAPMVLIESPAAVDAPVLSPWVRVIRREALREPDGSLRRRFFAIDFVHADYFGSFLQEHVHPFADQFAARAVGSADVLRRGARVPNIHGPWKFDEIRPVARKAP